MVTLNWHENCGGKTFRKVEVLNKEKVTLQKAVIYLNKENV